MDIQEIFNTYRTGSQGFIQAVQTHTGINASDTEIARIAEKANDADEFMSIWENEDWWAV